MSGKAEATGRRGDVRSFPKEHRIDTVRCDGVSLMARLRQQAQWLGLAKQRQSFFSRSHASFWEAGALAVREP
jgi:hypothetical protein